MSTAKRLRSRKAAPTPRHEVNARKATIVIDSSNEELAFKSPMKTVSVITAINDDNNHSPTISTSSFNADRPPPSSVTDFTTEPTIRRFDTLPIQHDPSEDIPSGGDPSYLIQRTPPRSAFNALPSVLGGASPTRTMSLPAQSPSSNDESFNGLTSSHRATSTMAKRTANRDRKSPRKLATTSTTTSTKVVSPIKAASKRLRRIVEEEHDDPGIISSNPIESTSSMPELRGSPINFLRDLINNEPSQRPRDIEKVKAGQKGSSNESAGQSGSGEGETQSSTASREQLYYARYGGIIEEVVRPVTQAIIGENPPGIIVHSQTQSDHGHSGDEGLEARGNPLRHAATTLVAGTPSTASESSQHERDLDLTQLYHDGRALLQHESPGTQLIATQSVTATQEYVPTQVLNDSGEDMLPTQPIDVTEDAADAEPATQSLVGTLEISPRKPGKYYTSSSGSSSIPGLNLTQDTLNALPAGERPLKPSDGRMAAPPVPQRNIPAATSNKQPIPSGQAQSLTTRPRIPVPKDMQPTRPHNVVPGNRQLHSAAAGGTGNSRVPLPAPAPLKRNPLMRRKSPAPIDGFLFDERKSKASEDIETVSIHHAEAETQMVETIFDTPTKANIVLDKSGAFQPTAMPAHVPMPLKRNPLMRRKSPAATDQFLFKREQAKTPSYREDTVPVEVDQGLTQETETQPIGVHTTETFYKDDTGLEKPEETVLSEVGDSEVMETDEEAEFKPNWSSFPPHAGLVDYTVPTNGLEDHNLTRWKVEDVNPRRRDVYFKDSTLQRKSSDNHVDQRNVTTRTPHHPRSRKGHDKKSAAVKVPSDHEESSSEDEDNASEYEPQETQTQGDFLEKEVVRSDEEFEGAPDPPRAAAPSHRGVGKRGASDQGGRNQKRPCIRNTTPKISPVPTSPSTSKRMSTTENTPRAKPVLPALDIPSPIVADISMTRPSRRSTRGQSISKTLLSPQAGHLVLVRYPEAKRYFPGYALARSGRSWEIRPCDERNTPTYAEPKNMRLCELQVDDLVVIAPRPGGEDWGDGIVTAVDQRWEEERHVKVKIGSGEESYVSVRYISVHERHISPIWNERKVTHKDLEKGDGLESIQKTPASLTRTASIIPTSNNGISAKPSTSYRGLHLPSRKIFNGIGFILTVCGLEDTKLIKDCGGHVYESWLDAFQFDGSIEKSKGGYERWIRKASGDSTRRRSASSGDLSPVKWIGNDNEEGVKSLFVVAGKVMMTAKISIALSFGIPCVSTKWLEACGTAGNRVDWIPYLLPSHTLPSPLSLIPGVLPSQSPDYQWSSEGYNNQFVLDNILTHPPLFHHRILLDKSWVLFIAPDCVSNLRKDAEGEAAPCKFPIVYCCLAMGAQNVEAVDQYSHATDPKLTKYDLIVMADAITEKIRAKDPGQNALMALLKKAVKKGAMVTNHSDIKMSIACGKLMKTSDFDLQ